MGRPPCCEETGVKKGPWMPEEDDKLMAYISKHGSGNWRTLPKHAGLNRCGKSCRLRWTNYLRPDIRRGKFTEEEEKLIINLHSVLGNKWSKITTHLPGRTDNEIKNFWNTNLRKKLLQMGIDPETHKPRTDFKHLLNLCQLLGMANTNNLMMSPAWIHGGLVGLLQQPHLSHQLAQTQLLQNLLQLMNANSSSFVSYMQSSLPLLGNQSLINNNPMEAADRNGTLPNNLSNQELYASPTALFPSIAPSNQSGHEVSESGTDLEEGASDQQSLGNNNSLSRTSSHELNEADENPFAATSSGSFNQMESFNDADGVPSTVFDPWEKLLEDDYASDSYWKELFDLTSTSNSLISW